MAGFVSQLHADDGLLDLDAPDSDEFGNLKDFISYSTSPEREKTYYGPDIPPLRNSLKEFKQPVVSPPRQTIPPKRLDDDTNPYWKAPTQCPSSDGETTVDEEQERKKTEGYRKTRKEREREEDCATKIPTRLQMSSGSDEERIPKAKKPTTRTRNRRTINNNIKRKDNMFTCGSSPKTGALEEPINLDLVDPEKEDVPPIRREEPQAKNTEMALSNVSCMDKRIPVRHKNQDNSDNGEGPSNSTRMDTEEDALTADKAVSLSKRTRPLEDGSESEGRDHTVQTRKKRNKGKEKAVERDIDKEKAAAIEEQKKRIEQVIGSSTKFECCA